MRGNIPFAGIVLFSLAHETFNKSDESFDAENLARSYFRYDLSRTKRTCICTVRYYRIRETHTRTHKVSLLRMLNSIPSFNRYVGIKMLDRGG